MTKGKMGGATSFLAENQHQKVEQILPSSRSPREAKPKAPCKYALSLSLSILTFPVGTKVASQGYKMDEGQSHEGWRRSHTR